MKIKPPRPASIVVAAALLAALPAALAQTPGSPLTVSVVDAPDSPAAAGVHAWCDKAASATQGRIRCAAASTPIARGHGIAALTAGRVDLAVVVHEDEATRFPINRMADLPFLGDFAETVSVAYQRIHDATPAMRDEHHGVKVLAVFTHSPGYLFARSAQISALAGLRSMAPSAGGVSAYAAAKALRVGSSIATTGPPPVTLAITTAQELPALRDAGGLRAATMVPGGLFNRSYVFAMNQARWDALPEQDRTLLSQLSGSQASGAFGRAYDAAEWRANIGERAGGVNFYPAEDGLLAQVKVAMRPVDAAWASGAARTGLRNPAKVLAAFRADIAKQEASN